MKNLAFVGVSPAIKTLVSFDLQARIAVNFLKDGLNFTEYLKKHRFFGKEEYFYGDLLVFQDKLAEEAGLIYALERLEREDKALYDMVLNGPWMPNHYLLTEENWGTESFDRNAAIIKVFNKSLNEPYFP